MSHLFAMTIDEDRPVLWKPFALRDAELSPMGDFNTFRSPDCGRGERPRRR
jgi:hypothetical protein